MHLLIIFCLSRSPLVCLSLSRIVRLLLFPPPPGPYRPAACGHGTTYIPACLLCLCLFSGPSIFWSTGLYVPYFLCQYTVPQSALFACPRVSPVSLSICLPVALSSYTVPLSALFICPRVYPVSLSIYPPRPVPAFPLIPLHACTTQ